MKEKTYNIEAQVIEYHSVDIEAESEKEAIEKAYEEYYDTDCAYDTDINVVSAKCLTHRNGGK